MARYSSVPFGVKTNTDRKKPDKSQVAVTYDLLSEGEIEGLANGLSSVFINDIPVFDKTANEIIKFRGATSNTTSGSNQVSHVQFGEIDDLVLDNLSGLRLGTRHVVVQSALAKATNASATADTNIITTGSSFFTTAMINQLFNNKIQGFVRLEGAGPSGSTLVTKATFISSTQIRTSQPISTTVSNKDLHVDLVTTIASISGNTATLFANAGVTLTGTPVSISGADISQTKLESLCNIENFGFSLATGTISQDPIILNTNFGQSSIIASPNIEMLQNNIRANIGTTGNAAKNGGNYNDAEIDEESQNQGTAADTLLTSAFLGVSNPSEVDEIHLTFNFPQCHALKSSSGAKGPSFVELQIFFEFSTDGGSSFPISALAFGDSDNDILNRSEGINAFISGFNFINNGQIKPDSPQYTSFVEEFVINTEQFQPYDDWRIRIRRINDLNFKDSSFQHTNPCTLQTVESIVKDKFSYPHSAYAATSFNAKDFNSQLPERSFTLKGLKIQVPTNYRTREETGTAASYTRNVSTGATESSYQNWDGNFRGDVNTFNESSINHNKVFCDNPVWVFYDLLTNERYGIGQFIDKSQIDIYELFRIAKYCDELVPDGNGGTEPRFTCNVYLGKGAEATTVLKQFASIFRGIALWNEGSLTVAVDRPKQPVFQFTKGNIIGGQFNYEGTGDRVRTNQVKVTWNDPDDNFRQSTEYVEDYDSIADTGRIVRSEQLAFGCTSRGQAHRLGKWKLLSEQNENETVSFSTSLNAASLKPGDIILVQDADRDRSSYSGRVSNSGTRSTTVIPLDRTISLPAYNSNFKHELHLIYPSGGAYLQEESAIIGGTTFFEGDLILSITSSTAAANAKDDSNNPINVVWSENTRVERQRVTTSAGNVNSLTVASAFSSVPNAEVIWALKLYNTDGTVKTGTAKEYRVITVNEEDDFLYEITGSLYHKNKFLEIERGYNIAPRPLKTMPDPEDIVPSPRNIVINVQPITTEDTDGSTDDGTLTGHKVVITWDYPQENGAKYKFCNGFEIQHDFLNSKTVELVGSSEQALNVNNVSAGTYRVKIRTKSSIGTVSPFLQREVTITERELLPPTKSRLEQIQRGGEVNQTIGLAANGTVSLGSSTYTMTSPDGSIFSNTNSNSATHTQAFAGMGASAEAFLLFDTSESTDRLKAIQVHTDSGSTPSINYIKEVGASNNGLTAGSGSIQINQFSNQVNGTGTSFESDFIAGDLFRIAGGSSTTRTTSGSITNSKSVTLSSTNSNIKVGQTVTGTGIINPCHVSEISGTSLTLSNQQTINSGVTLTFTPLITYARVRFVESDTLLFLDETTNRPYNEAEYFKQSFIPDTNSDFILARITTNGSTAYTLADQFVTSAPADSPQFVKGNVYFSAWNGTSSLPSTPTASAFVFSTKSLTGLTSGWSLSKPLPPYAVSGFSFREGDGSVTFDTVRGVSSWLRLPPDDFRIEIDDTNRRIKIRPDVNDTGFDQVTSATQLFNDRITTNADGTINYDGTTAVAPNINNIVDSGNTKTGAARGFAGLAANGDVNRAVPTGKGGTGETNTNKFLNSDLGITLDGTTITLTKAGDTNSTDTVPSTLKNSTISIDGNGKITGANSAFNSVVLSNDKIVSSNVVGTGKLFATTLPEDGATLGAVAGTNLKDSGGASLGDEDVRNSDLSVDFTGNTTFRIKKGSTVIDTQAFNKGNVGLSDLNSLDSAQNSKLTGIEASATVGARAGTNLKAADGSTTLGDDDVKNSALDVAISGTAIKLKIGSTETSTVTATQGLVGLSGVENNATVGAVLGTNLKASNGTTTLGDNDVKNDALDVAISGTAIKLKIGSTETSTVTATQGLVGLSGVENNATVGARAGTNLKKADGTTTLGDADIVTSQGTSNDTSNVNSITSANVTGGVTQVNTNLGGLQDSLEDGTASVNASAIDIGELNTDRLNLQELFLPTTGTASTGVTHSITSSGQNTTRFLFDAGTGPGYYVGHISFDNSIRTMRGGRISQGGPVLFLQAGGSTLFQGSMFATHSYDRNRGQDTADGPYHMPFAFFYTGTGTVKVNVKLETTSGTESLSIKGRAVKFGAELASFDTSSFTASRTVSAGSGNSDSGTVTVSTAGGGTSSVSLSGNTSALVSINGGTFVNAASVGTISNNQTFEIRIPASSSNGVTRSATVTIDGISATYSVVTSGTYSSGGYGSGGSGTGGLPNIFDLR